MKRLLDINVGRSRNLFCPREETNGILLLGNFLIAELRVLRIYVVLFWEQRRGKEGTYKVEFTPATTLKRMGPKTKTRDNLCVTHTFLVSSEDTDGYTVLSTTAKLPTSEKRQEIRQAAVNSVHYLQFPRKAGEGRR